MMKIKTIFLRLLRYEHGRRNRIGLLMILLWAPYLLFTSEIFFEQRKLIPQLFKAISKLESLHQSKIPAVPGDWLSIYRERGQLFKEYLKIHPTTISNRRNVIYIQPLGDFSDKQRRLIEITAEYMGLFFNMKTIIKTDIPDKQIPMVGMRGQQVYTFYVLKRVLKPRLPKDAAVFIAFTPRDLTPGGGWNFVFGQATLKQRIGVWSFNRFGDPEESDDMFMKCLVRTIKVASHESGHIFSMRHCTKYQCLMNGCNHLGEMDRSPLYLCPECVSKLCYATNTPIRRHYENLSKFARKYRLNDLYRFCRKSLRQICP